MEGGMEGLWRPDRGEARVRVDGKRLVWMVWWKSEVGGDGAEAGSAEV